MSEQTQTQLTEAQAVDLVYRGVLREVKADGERTLSYCRDAVKLQGYNVRKLATKAQVRAEDRGEVFNADSYQSNVSNANGVMALFGYDLAVFEEWLKTAESKSLSKIFKQFRELFTEPKAKTPKPSKGEGDNDGAGEKAETPLIDVVLSAIPHLSREERMLVSMMIVELDTAKADVEEATEEPVAA